MKRNKVIKWITFLVFRSYSFLLKGYLSFSFSYMFFCSNKGELNSCQSWTYSEYSTCQSSCFGEIFYQYFYANIKIMKKRKTKYSKRWRPRYFNAIMKWIIVLWLFPGITYFNHMPIQYNLNILKDFSMLIKKSKLLIHLFIKSVNIYWVSTYAKQYAMLENSWL